MHLPSHCLATERARSAPLCGSTAKRRIPTSFAASSGGQQNSQNTTRRQLLNVERADAVGTGETFDPIRKPMQDFLDLLRPFVGDASVSGTAGGAGTEIRARRLPVRL